MPAATDNGPSIVYRPASKLLQFASRAQLNKGRLDAQIPSLVSHHISREPTRTRGRVVTFYSYKGGVGRSRALANVALQLALRGDSVACVDFDLEAPGLSSYFLGESFAWTSCRSGPGIDPEKHIGLIDFFCSYRDSLFTRSPMPTMPLCDLVQTIDVAAGQAKIDFIGAGKQDHHYKQRVTNFDWRSFYDCWDGGVLIDKVKRELIEKYRYVLVDSRTGITDISGICSVHLPDVLVAAFTPGPQSQTGLVDALKCIEANSQELRKNQPLQVLPLPCRVDRDVVREAYDSWFKTLLNSYFAEKAAVLRWHWKPEEYFRRVAIEHFSRFVFDDSLESLAHHIDDEAGNAWKYRNLIEAIDLLGPIAFPLATLGMYREPATVQMISFPHGLQLDTAVKELK